MNDLRFALRQLLKNPGFTAVAVLTLALGIGATSSVFSLIDGVLLTPPPYLKPDRIVLIEPARFDGQPFSQGCTSGQWLEWQKAINSFETIAGYEWIFQILNRADGSESIEGLAVTPDYFKVTGIKPLLGRVFLPSDMPTKPGQDRVMLLGHDLWQRRFNGDKDILGQTVHLSHGQSLIVVGVMPPGVRFLPSRTRGSEPNYNVNAQVDYWKPLWPLDRTRSDEIYCNVAGRLRDDATREKAQAELTTIAAQQAKADHALEGITARIQVLADNLNSEGRRVLLPLFGAVALVFLIACANVAGLLLTRGLQRQQEYAVRCALGAQRSQLFCQGLLEALLLALVGGALGVGLAATIVKVISITGAHAIPRLDAVRIGGLALAFCFGSAVLAAVIAGLAPAFHAARSDPAEGLRGTRASVSRTERRFLGGIAIIQIALTLALLTGAGLLIRTVHNLTLIHPGYETQNILTMNVTVTDPKKFADFHSQALGRIAALPGVKKTAFGWGVPLTGNSWPSQVRIEGQSPKDTGTGSDFKNEIAIATRSVTADYFDLLSMPVTMGRNFRPADAWFGPHAVTNAPFVAMINQALVAKYFGRDNPIGRKLRFSPGLGASAEIIGVVANSRNNSLTEKSEPEVYFSFWQLDAFTKHLLIRTASDPRSLIGTVQRELRAIDPAVAIEGVRTLDQIRNESVASQTFAMRLLGGFSLAGCALALVGIYGVLSLAVGSRRREIAIRMAVGAQRRHVLQMILRDGWRLIVAGLIIGTGLALALARSLRAFLFGVEPVDPLTFSAAAILFSAVALLASFVPARRAVRTDPMEALRHE